MSTVRSRSPGPDAASRQPRRLAVVETPRPPSGVLERGIAILQCFGEERLRLQLRDIAEATGLDKATALRLLGVLVKARLVQRDERGCYALGPSLLHMGMLYRRSFDTGSRLQPALRETMERTGETVAFFVRDGDDRICLFRENSTHELRHHVEVGTRLPLAAGGSSAHVLKAYTGGATPLAAAIRRDGYAITREERVPQMASVAVPVFELDGTFEGALVVVGLVPRQSAAAQKAAVRVARDALARQGFVATPRSLPAGSPHKPT